MCIWMKNIVLVYKADQGSILMDEPTVSCLSYHQCVDNREEEKYSFWKKHSEAEAFFIRFHTPKITWFLASSLKYGDIMINIVLPNMVKMKVSKEWGYCMHNIYETLT